MHNYSGLFTKGNYKTTFTSQVEWLIKRNLPVKERIKAVDELLEAYVAQVGEVPDSVQLTRLADYILRDDLRDRHPDKVSNTEYPFLSVGQQKLRGRREPVMDTSRMSNDVKHRLFGRKKSITISL